MPDIDIRCCTVAEIEGAGNVSEFLAQYSQESSIPELGTGCAQFDTYRAMEAAGVLGPIGAFEAGNLLGVILPLIGPLPHYGTRVAIIESFFVLPAYRKTGIGLRLLDRAENISRDLGAKGMLITAPVGSNLQKVIANKQAYRHSNDVFVRAFA